MSVHLFHFALQKLCPRRLERVIYPEKSETKQEPFYLAKTNRTGLPESEVVVVVVGGGGETQRSERRGRAGHL